jgi:hypothetical protein
MLPPPRPAGRFNFVQISDSRHFHLPPADPRATLTEAIDKIKAMPTQPAFLSIPRYQPPLQGAGVDDADQVIKSANKQVFFLPGETTRRRHWGAARALQKIRRARAGSFDMAGVHPSA